MAGVVADDASDTAYSSKNVAAAANPLIPKPRAAPAFTLVEMLVVMSVIVILISVTVPVFRNLLGGRGVESSINNVTGVLELGRTTAVANRTYVFVLFKNVVNSDNNCELRSAVVMSKNNLKSRDVTNTTLDPANLSSVTKVVKTLNIQNVLYSKMPLAVQNVTPPELADDKFYIDASASTSDFPSYAIADENFKGATYICYYPDGEIASSVSHPDPYNLLVEPKICLGLIPASGPTAQPAAKDGSIIATYGGSGATRIIRP